MTAAILILFSGLIKVYGIGYDTIVAFRASKDFFPIENMGKAAPLCLSGDDFPGVLKVADMFKSDIEHVTGKTVDVRLDNTGKEKDIIIIGTIGKSSLIDKLIKNKKIDVSGVQGKWESCLTQAVNKPLPGVEHALVIAGSDKRGTIYGMFNISEQIGVSPWYWWADVPIKKHENLFVIPGRHILGEPAVKYRGIFLNDEAPALSGWAYKKFGGFNHKFYVKVFELMLRMKANYLWPAMWGHAFNDDDSLNPKLANEYGIVMGTSHHEPMMRAHDEWRRYGSGPWNYQTNAKNLQEFWRKGIERMDHYESIVTIGMRGNGDMPMSQNANIALLEKIVHDQREIIHEVTGKDPSQVPQVWALYKEVQEYYDKGMRVPDDVTLLLCDDNWGNIRRLPKRGDTLRKGGYGIYYHFDYVGGPRNYKWLNTNQVSRVWEQMHLAYKYGVKQIWIVNVGDLKPMEYPIQFFLDYAWNPHRWTLDKLPDYARQWAEEQFGPENAAENGYLLTTYTTYNSRRKPELLSPETYSLADFNEWDNVASDYDHLANKAELIYDALPEQSKAAYYQLIYFPIQACSNLNDLYYTVAKNRLYASQGRASANDLAAKAHLFFERDSILSDYYNNTLENGKWNHMMDQTHIGYTYWQQPDKNTMPKVQLVKLLPSPDLGVAIEGSDNWWPNDSAAAVLPAIDKFNKQNRYIDIFNRGENSFNYTVKSDVPWLIVNPSEGKIDKQQRVFVSADWSIVPAGSHDVLLKIKSIGGKTVTVKAVIKNPDVPKLSSVEGFVENNGYISMEAQHYSKKIDAGGMHWECIPNLGRTLSAMTVFPVTAMPKLPGNDSPYLEYEIYTFSSGKIKVDAYFSPTLNFHNSPEGLRYAVSIDDEKPQVINMLEGENGNTWNKLVADNIRVVSSTHNLQKPGKHVLKFWAIDPGVDLQKLVVETGKVPPSYLGPPESFHK